MRNLKNLVTLNFTVITNENLYCYIFSIIILLFYILLYTKKIMIPLDRLAPNVPCKLLPVAF